MYRTSASCCRNERVGVEMVAAPTAYHYSGQSFEFSCFHSSTFCRFNLAATSEHHLSETQDYLLKDTNDTGKEFFWPSQQEIDSKGPLDRETVFRVEIANHSQETLASGKLLFRLTYNIGLSGGGCMPPKGGPKFQEDFVLLPQLDSGKSFDFYAVNQSSSCVWLIPPEKALVKMISDDTERRVALTFDKNSLYSSGAPVFPPTTIKWEALPSRPNSYQIQRIVH
jgi:hypothetical protein